MQGKAMTDTTDPDVRLERFHLAPMPEVSPSLGIRIFNAQGHEIAVLPPSVKLYTYLLARLSAELQVMSAKRQD